MRLEEGRIKVSRILVDSIIDRQGLVQCGDIILQACSIQLHSAITVPILYSDSMGNS